MNVETIKLILLDLDGTLAEFKTGNILPNVKETIAALPAGIQLAICSNQGGVGLRHWMLTDGFGWENINNYPTEKEIRAHVDKVQKEIGISVPVYFCFAYQSNKTSKWNPEPDEDETEDMNCWRRDWRKPQPGMLLAAIEAFGVSPEETLMVGDWAEDEMAALAAGCHFQWDYDFFKRPKGERR